ncbi:hypothetical protein D5F01_LYC23808 [Larimichthys crocea]|uniref:Uncharacterized protein n=1 Tax=Larimichthys crocea TaxID=215358 RepID=A0A6G0HFX5_LARCR|nr:hypothetical protein D5F01_LYC23808 [Larimichthys crocea]
MPAKKAQNKSKAHSSPCEEDDDVSEANSLANSTGDATLVPHVDVDTGLAHNTGVIQILEGIRNDFSTKMDVVLKAIQDVKRDVRDFSVRMDEAGARISSVEDTMNAEKGKTEALVKQVALLTNKLVELENHSRRSNLRLVNVLERWEEMMRWLSWRSGSLKSWDQRHSRHHLSSKERTGCPDGRVLVVQPRRGSSS